MGFLIVDGYPLTWEELSAQARQIRIRAAFQLMNLWDRYKDLSTPELRWGDEVFCNQIG